MESDNALLNSCVLQHLFEFVDIETLKMCRHVCKTWNFFASFQLRKTTWVCLQLVEERQAFADTFNIPSDGSMRMMRNFELRCENFSVTLSVLLQYRLSIVSLDLHIFDNYLADTLLSLPSLEHLTIRSINSSPEIPDWNRRPFGGIQFPKLKSCSLVCGFSDGSRLRSHVLTSILMDFYIDLLRSSEKTLQRLQLSRFGYSDLREIFQKINFQGISDLVLQEVDPISQNSVDMTAKELELFKKLVRVQCCNITRLKCWVPESLDEERIQDFYSIILESCEKNLKTLHLSWRPRSSYIDLFTKMNFPALTQLVIDCSDHFSFYYQPVLHELKSFLANCRKLCRLKCWIPNGSTSENIRDILENLVGAEEVELLAKSCEGTSPLTRLPNFLKMTRLTLPAPLGLPLATLASSLPKIRHLSIVLPEYGSEGWNRMEHLKELVIKTRNDSTLHYHRHSDITFVNFPNLTNLTITLSAGSGDTIFCNLRNLKYLYLEAGSSLCDEDITGIESERLLTLQDHPKFVRDHAWIGDLKYLQVLHLEGPFITEVSLKYGICNLDSLTHLTIQFPRLRVTKILYQGDDLNGDNTVNNRGLGSSVREVRLRRINVFKSLNIQSLMLPRLPKLEEFILINREERALLIHPLQIEQMIDSRPKFRYLRPPIQREASIIEFYGDVFVFENENV